MLAPPFLFQFSRKMHTPLWKLILKEDFNMSDKTKRRVLFWVLFAYLIPVNLVIWAYTFIKLIVDVFKGYFTIGEACEIFIEALECVLDYGEHWIETGEIVIQ